MDDCIRVDCAGDLEGIVECDCQVRDVEIVEEDYCFVDRFAF